MKDENKAFLDANRHHYNLLVNAGIVKHLDGATRDGLLRIIREEFAPNYIASTWCQSCVANILKFAYVQYDKWIVANPETSFIDQQKEIMLEKFQAGMVEVVMAGSPTDLDDSIVKATFPKHDQPKKKRGKKK